MRNLIDIITTILMDPLTIWVMGLLVANIIIDFAVSIYNKTFALAQIADWLETRVLPYLCGGVAVQILIYAAPKPYSDFANTLGAIVWGFVIAALVGHILSGLKELGITGIPQVMTKNTDNAGAASKPEK